MYDYFVAALKCPNCAAVSPATSATNMQTHLRDDAHGIELGVGDQLDPRDLGDDDIADSGYLPVNRRDDARIRLLDQWQCPTCQRENWAQVTVDGSTISAIEAVTLDRATLMRAQFITESCFILAAQLSGIPADDLMTGKVSPVSVLLDRLP